jgi:hypothetical protein
MSVNSCMFLSRRSLLCCGIARYPYTHFSLFYRPRSLAGTGSIVLCTISRVTPPGIFYPSLDPRAGTIARTLPILVILEIVGRYKYPCNIR